MKKIRAAVVGLGNVGKCVVEALERAPDFEIAGVVRRKASGLGEYSDISELAEVDVAIVCSPSRLVESTAAPILESGICTVDSFDIHSEIVGVRERLDGVARGNRAVAVVSAGWDPGSDSVVRALLEACAPQGTTFTNFGPGMSMGHSVAARAAAGVVDALSMTIPVGGGVHRREVFVELEDGADFEDVSRAIKADPYFARDETSVVEVEDVCSLVNVGHGVKIERTGASGTTEGQRFEFTMRINNPALTAQIMVSCARAAVRARDRGDFGARTMIEIPPVDLLAGTREENIARLV